MTQPISRRAVARGAAWSIPAVTVAGAAPALAASAGCTSGPVTVNLGAGTRTVLAVGSSGMPSKIQWAYTDTKTGVTVTVTTTAIGGTVLGRRTRPDLDTYQDTDLTFDGGLNIQHVTTGTNGEGENVHIAFTRKGAPVNVSNFTMTIADVDTLSGRWVDAVTLATSGIAATVGSNIDGNGSPGAAKYTSGPWHSGVPIANDKAAETNVNLPAESISLTAGAALSAVDLSYTNVTSVNGVPYVGKGSDQNIQLTGVTFQAPAC